MSKHRIIHGRTASQTISQINMQKAETGKYVCDVVLELKKLSHKAGLKFLAQILEMAYQEAFMVANRVEPSKAELEEAAQVMERTREWAKEKKASP